MLMNLWLVATLVVTSVSPKKPGIDEVVKIPKKVRCNNTMTDLMNKILETAACDAKEVYLGLAPPSTFQSIDPVTVWVKRCIGDCSLIGGDTTCLPQNTARKNIPITLYNVWTKQYQCSTYTIEEHLSCSCDSAKSSCAPKGAVVELDGPVSDVVHPGIDPGSVFLKRCAGSCGEYDMDCTPVQTEIKELVLSSGTYQAEEHTSCHCFASKLFGPCGLHTSYPLGPFFVTKRCIGSCVNSDYECIPIKTVTVDVPNKKRTWAQHSDCICAKRLGK